MSVENFGKPYVGARPDGLFAASRLPERTFHVDPEPAMSLEARVALARGWQPSCISACPGWLDTFGHYYGDAPPPITAEVVLEMMREFHDSETVFVVRHGESMGMHWCQVEMLTHTYEGEGLTIEAAVSECWLAFKEVGA